MRYRDVAGAIAWLGRAFGFQEHHVVRCEDGSILYAVLTFANAMIMLGSVRSTEFDGLMKQPDEIGGAETQSCYFVVDDAAAHCAAAKAAGAAIVLDVKEYDYGGQGYSCRDPEGHIWSFGTYDPCGASATRDRVRRRNRLVGAALGALLVAIGVGGWLAVAGQFGSLIETRNGIAEVLAGRQAAATATATAENEALRRIGQELIEERHSREAVERALVLERSAKVAAERAAEAARSRLAEWQKTRGSDSQEQSSLPGPSKQMQVPKPRPARKATPGVAVRPVPAP